MRIVVAGAPPPTRTIERIETELGWEFIQIYGLTETTPLLTMNRARAEFDELSPAERAAELSRAGAPAIGVEMRGRADGEVLARGNHIMAGYWEQPEATAEAIHPPATIRRAATGSTPATAASIDDDHYVTISDRKKDVIISGGENVSSIEVEDAVFSHPEVAEVAVIGVPDEKWGELVMALVVRAPGAGVAEADADRLHARRSSPATSARSGSSSATSSPARPPASCRSSSSASRTGRARRQTSTDADASDRAS